MIRLQFPDLWFDIDTESGWQVNPDTGELMQNPSLPGRYPSQASSDLPMANAGLGVSTQFGGTGAGPSEHFELTAPRLDRITYERADYPGETTYKGHYESTKPLHKITGTVKHSMDFLNSRINSIIFAFTGALREEIQEITPVLTGSMKAAWCVTDQIVHIPASTLNYVSRDPVVSYAPEIMERDNILPRALSAINIEEVSSYEIA